MRRPAAACCRCMSSLTFFPTAVVRPIPAPSRGLRRLNNSSRRMISTLPKLPLFEAIAGHDPDSTAVIHSLSGRRFRYGELLGDVTRARDQLLSATGKTSLDGERIAFLVENSYDYVVTLLAAFAARSIAVPLSPAFPAAELQYIINQSQASLLVNSAKYADKARDVLATDLEHYPAQLEIRKHLGGGPHEKIELEDADFGGAGMMLYTSGTTNRPKGVLLPQSVLTAQARSLIEAWEYSSRDHLLHVLPLHHIHGTVNALLTPLLAGSAIEFLFPFNPSKVWSRLAAPLVASPLPNSQTNNTNDNHNTPPREKITFFTVVPTVYSRLLSSHKDLAPELSEPARDAVSPAHMRLAISGSAALPTPIKDAWRRLSRGTVLLERYGMTEVGMALSCGLRIADRVDASVGWPLPGVQARLADLDTGAIIPEGPEGRHRPGEIQLRGPTIFKEYWRNPAATAKEFVQDGDERASGTPNGQGGRWFRTGDVAVRRAVDGAGQGGEDAQPWAKGDMYFILGRKSADIIKTGGEKVSALEVERELLSLDEVSEAAVVSVPSGKWGQKVGAVVILNREVVPEGARWSPMDMRRALRHRLANYKIPQVLKVVDHIPRNAMGKINKKELVKAVFADQFSEDEL
ncbi:hypothetical protein ACRALDRAFT_1057272 [Sodiomyces alcalophilus JCM 7366]|uniref:uncharacterized protein n=1 Tax=Sodiomyces alcalophilus JCM 7366 TaxID=591952 RepID=UPI0039B3AB66